MNRRVLIVSPHFPPVNAPDMQRVRVSLPYFVAAGWQVTVLTVADPTPTAPVEPELEATVPAAVRVVRMFCLSRRWTGMLGVNNVALRSWPFLFLAGCRLLSGRRHDVVYFSTTMFIVLPLGRLWKALTGVPYVIDLQDPWITDFYERPGAPRPPGGWKYRVAQGLGRALEGWTMRGAAHLIAVSQGYIDTLRMRHPQLRSTPAIELPFGSPDPDLALAAARRRIAPRLRRGAGTRPTRRRGGFFCRAGRGPPGRTAGIRTFLRHQLRPPGPARDACTRGAIWFAGLRAGITRPPPLP